MGKIGILLALTAAIACAASDDDAIKTTFVKPFVEAVQSKDAAKAGRLLHPAVHACITPAKKEFFDFVLDHEVHEVAKGGYLITKLTPLRQAPPTFLPEEDVRYPVQPTYEINIQFEATNLVFTRFLAASKGSWYEVYPCPNEKGMAYFREHMQESAEQKKKTAQLLAALRDPLRSELEELVGHGHSIDAIHKYQQATGADLATAVSLVNALQRSVQ